jgi:hypothetical protein
MNLVHALGAIGSGSFTPAAITAIASSMKAAFFADVLME